MILFCYYIGCDVVSVRKFDWLASGLPTGRYAGVEFAWPCKCVTFLTLLSAKQHFFLFYLGEGAFCWTKEDQEVLTNVTVVLAADGEFAFRICKEADVRLDT